MDQVARVLFDCYLVMCAAFAVNSFFNLDKSKKRHHGMFLAGLGFIFRLPMAKHPVPAGDSIVATVVAMLMLVLGWIYIWRLPTEKAHTQA